MRTLLIFPTRFEAECFFRAAGETARLGKTAHLKVGDANFCGLVSGYACEASKNRVQTLWESGKFDFAVLCGFCGACDESLRESDAIFDSDSESLCGIFLNLGIKKAKIASVERVADSQKKRELARLGFCVVDMEAGLFKPIVKAENFASFRVVSDSLNSRIPAEFFDMMIDRNTGDSKIDFCKILRMILKNPKLIFDLIRFGISASKVKKNYEKYLMDSVLNEFGK